LIRASMIHTHEEFFEGLTRFYNDGSRGPKANMFASDAFCRCKRKHTLMPETKKIVWEMNSFLFFPSSRTIAGHGQCLDLLRSKRGHRRAKAPECAKFLGSIVK
jgi:hypothetical protein